MPSQILHILFGEDVFAEVCRRLPSESRSESLSFSGTVSSDESLPSGAAGKALRAIQGAGAGFRGENLSPAAEKAFALGCQGPDIFYHSQGRTPVGLEYGTLMHRRGIGNFTAELLRAVFPAFPAGEGAPAENNADGNGADENLARNCPDKPELIVLEAYSLGFMTHALLDRAAHPYIVYKSGWLSPSNPETFRYDRSHAFFERIIDTLMLKRLRGTEVSAWDQDGLLADSCEAPPPRLKELLARSLVLAFPERAGKDGKLGRRIENTFHDSASFYRLTSPRRTPVKNPAASSEEFPLKRRHLVYLYPESVSGRIDFLNLEHSRWYNPGGDEKGDTRSFPEIYADAVKSAANSFAGIIGRYLGEGIFPAEEAAAAIGNGGLSIVDANGKPCAPVRADPLPLDEELGRQAALRGIQE